LTLERVNKRKYSPFLKNVMISCVLCELESEPARRGGEMYARQASLLLTAAKLAKLNLISDKMSESKMLLSVCVFTTQKDGLLKSV